MASADYAAAVSAYRKAVVTAANARRIADVDKDLVRASRRLAARSRPGRDRCRQCRGRPRCRLAGPDRAQRRSQATISDIRAGKPLARIEGLIRSPLAGTVVERLITPGQLLQAGTTAAFTVADLSQVWVMAQVFESDLGAVGVGDSARVDHRQPAPSPARSTTSPPQVDPDTRSMKVRVVVDNPGGLLKRQMYVHVLIQARQESTGLLVPVSAMLRDDENLPFVYVAQPDGSFARRHVTLGYAHRRPLSDHRRPACRRPDRGRWRPLRSIHAEPMSDHPASPPRRRRMASIMNRLVASSLRQRVLIVLLTLLLIGAGHPLAGPPAGGRLSRPVAAHGRDHHPMARPCRRGSGTADHRADRASA